MVSLIHNKHGNGNARGRCLVLHYSCQGDACVNRTRLQTSQTQNFASPDPHPGGQDPSLHAAHHRKENRKTRQALVRLCYAVPTFWIHDKVLPQATRKREQKSRNSEIRSVKIYKYMRNNKRREKATLYPRRRWEIKAHSLSDTKNGQWKWRLAPSYNQ